MSHLMNFELNCYTKNNAFNTFMPYDSNSQVPFVAASYNVYYFIM